MGLVFLQANDGRSSMRSFDVVASQNLPSADRDDTALRTHPVYAGALKAGLERTAGRTCIIEPRHQPPAGF